VKLPRRTIKRGRIEIIPMIDTILILLIFYMSFSTLTRREKRIDAKMPSLWSPPQGVEPPTTQIMEVYLHVHHKDKIVVNGDETRPYDLPQLLGYMRQASTVGQEMTVVIQGDPDTSYQDVVAALDMCALAKLTRVAFRPIAEEGTGATAVP
jgi:biopolymer transport protein ExbD